MRAIDKLRWIRISSGQWYAELLDYTHNRFETFTCERMGKRRWDLLQQGRNGEWECIGREKTWRECRKWVAGYYSEWINFSDTLQTTTHADPIAR